MIILHVIKLNTAVELTDRKFACWQQLYPWTLTIEGMKQHPHIASSASERIGMYDNSVDFDLLNWPIGSTCHTIISLRHLSRLLNITLILAIRSLHVLLRLTCCLQACILLFRWTKRHTAACMLCTIAMFVMPEANTHALICTVMIWTEVAYQL